MVVYFSESGGVVKMEDGEVAKSALQRMSAKEKAALIAEARRVKLQHDRSVWYIKSWFRDSGGETYRHCGKRLVVVILLRSVVKYARVGDNIKALRKIRKILVIFCTLLEYSPNSYMTSYD